MKVIHLFLFYLLIFSVTAIAQDRFCSDCKPIAIYHAFDTPYDDLSDGEIFKIKNSGYTHIQISPTQKSLEYGAWHDKYQPIAYEINNRYGDQQALKRLTERAHEFQIKVIADVVFNHLGGVPGLEGSEWKSAIDGHHEAKLNELKIKLFHTYGKLFSGIHEGNVFDYFKFWNPDGWIGGNLPQLNTANPEVKKIQKNYLETLIASGVDGFRFDAATHIDREAMKEYAELLKDRFWSYGEVVEFDHNTIQTYGQILPITDYIFTYELIRSFSYTGSLSALKVPKSNQIADSVTFAVTHDTWAASVSGGKQGVGIIFPSEEDGDLAALYVLARHNGVPLILAKDAEKPSIRSAVRFRYEMATREAPMEFILESSDLCEKCSPQTVMLLERGEPGFAILNKSNQDVTVDELNISSYQEAKGCYQDINSLNQVQIEEEEGKKIMKSLLNPFVILKRDGTFFVQTSKEGCLVR